MPRYRITRLWSLAGYVTSEIDADSEESARTIEERAWEKQNAVALLPPALQRRIEEIYEEVDSVEEVA